MNTPRKENEKRIKRFPYVFVTVCVVFVLNWFLLYKGFYEFLTGGEREAFTTWFVIVIVCLLSFLFLSPKSPIIVDLESIPLEKKINKYLSKFDNDCA